uniref:Uncharacterized protein n=1 Tax=Arundo donax TaxID=35708 RepID=A0A0A9D3K2_ARUDO
MFLFVPITGRLLCDAIFASVITGMPPLKAHIRVKKLNQMRKQCIYETIGNILLYLALSLLVTICSWDARQNGFFGEFVELIGR